MVEYLAELLNLLKDIFQLVGVVFITYKGSHAIWVYFKSLFDKTSTDNLRFYIFKFDLGRGISLGLELIVVGDVISTTIDQDFSNLLKLALLVVTRTAINFFLEKDLQSIPEKDRIAIQNM